MNGFTPRSLNGRREDNSEAESVPTKNKVCEVEGNEGHKMASAPLPISTSSDCPDHMARCVQEQAIISHFMNHTVTLDLTEDEYYELKSALEMNRRLAEHFDNDEKRFRSQEIQKKLDASERSFRKVDQEARPT